ncbi:putative aspartate aminotransferase domain protein [Mycobacterium xenopi 4042]|uniref:alanine transaminase n=1 Tax=Mycobacterium xenopi 4042 TaxID=1299334 RepID=X8DM41_MYCXE|nr:putative aspartate aminotransferase domain protein [Mycobacterium xenopi 4042]
MVDVTTHQLPWHTSAHHQRQRTFAQSSKLQDVLYEIRGPVHAHAARLEAEGHRILKLNIGNPAPFGFEAPDVIMRDMIQALPYAQGYSDSKGILPARRAVVTRYELVDGFPQLDVDDVYLGNGVSELITMTLQALLDNGDQVLIPAPTTPCGPRRRRWPAAHPCITCAMKPRAGSPTSPTWSPRSPNAPKRWSSSTRTTRPAPCTAAKSSPR